MPTTASDDRADLIRYRKSLQALLKRGPSAELEQALKDVDAEIGPTNSGRAVTWGRFNKTVAFLMEHIAPVIRGFVRTELASRDQRLDALEARMEQWKHCGTWDAGRRFKAGNHVVHHGSTFVAQADCIGVEPASGEESGGVWQMSAKRGRNGKDSGR